MLFSRHREDAADCELFNALDDAKYELDVARAEFNSAIESSHIDACIHAVDAAQARYQCLLLRAKEEGVVRHGVFRKPLRRAERSTEDA